MNDDSSTESLIVAKGKTAPRITLAHIEEQISSEATFNVGRTLKDCCPVSDSLSLLTICCLTLKNGFVVTGESACASPENYDEEIGNRIARQNAVQKIWQLEGYALRSQLASA